ncbi:MAG TPA: adenylate kinase [Acidimicrobiales bacterium]|nr:adenylate kinase [Acidimicrobiales bacterium]
MVPGARLIVLGKQGAGKGTQCVRLSHHYVIPHISTGDMLRAEVHRRTELGLEAKSYMDAGELIPDEVVLAMVRKRLDQDDTRERGFVLDGFPRTVPQAEGLTEILSPVELDLVVNLVVPTGLVLRRLASRRVCQDCQTNYSTTSPPKVDWICDVCGGEVVERPDDNVSAIQRRLDLYEVETAPLITWYRRAGKLVSLSGVGSADAVGDRIIEAVDAHRAGVVGETPHSISEWFHSPTDGEDLGGGAPDESDGDEKDSTDEAGPEGGDAEAGDGE